MFISILGLVAILVSTTILKANPQASAGLRAVRVVGFVMVVAGLALACFKTIQPGSVGVQKLFGKVQDGLLTEGLNVVNPLVEVVPFNISTQEYTMSAVHDEGEQEGDDAIRILTADGLEVTIDLTVLYRVQPERAVEILRGIKGGDFKGVIVRPITRTRIRDNAVFYDAIALYSTKREEFQQKIFGSIQKDFEQRGLLLENILIRNIALPQAVKSTIESKIQAEQESQKMRFVLDKEKQEADRKRVEAQGIADYQRIIGQGLTDRQLQYEAIKAQKELAQSPNSKIIVMPSGKTAPIILGNQ